MSKGRRRAVSRSNGSSKGIFFLVGGALVVLPSLFFGFPSQVEADASKPYRVVNECTVLMMDAVKDGEGWGSHVMTDCGEFRVTDTKVEAFLAEGQRYDLGVTKGSFFPGQHPVITEVKNS